MIFGLCKLFDNYQAAWCWLGLLFTELSLEAFTPQVNTMSFPLVY